ncbi:beta-N-acetylhexosaminidase [Gemmatimonas phototrophica]|uniref:beta-N-acetylhexosaminidase n=1 Tax=Gemmatimonas phototrophica TaxID=1379270 RepID=A0A143BIX8_9BACT|nr:beta-N-acetylhexosaminidase [Gemmatimonas phototrophica]AMW04531.1 beta-N-acetylglucosaminidase [Gemmatimonas phototrophica]
MRLLTACTAALLVCPEALSAQASMGERYAIIPRPAVLTPGTGRYTIGRGTVVAASPAFAAVARRFVRDIANPTGYDLSTSAATRTASGIVLRQVKGLAADAYRLDVTARGIVAEASTPSGAFYALETVKQLLPPAIYRSAPVPGTAWTVPAVHVEDTPRFSWRGAHLDVARHFMPKEFVKKYIDLLARHKMNRFHWHLTEDQGWRIEIKKYPRLTEVGSCREQTLVGPFTDDPKKQVFDGRRHCGFYTQDDVREVVAYAAERMVTVVPEIEMPGHVQAAVYAYPFLASTTDSIPGLRTIWGVSPYILNPSDRSVAFMQDVLTEVLALFPSPWIHIGGDEAIKDQWKASPQIQARIKSLGLKDEHEMQSWFIRQMDAFLTKKGRRLIGWDEILEGGLAENATVMSWRGMAGGIAAAKEGHDVVMAPGSHTYFDHYQSQDKASEPLAIGGFTNIERVYGFEPLPAELTPEQAKHILGAQAQLWTEYIPNPRQLEYMAYPRLVALCEALWSRTDRRDFGDFMQRLPVHLKRLDALDVNYRRLDKASITP